MKKRFIILGLSSYGSFLAEYLDSEKAEIIAADVDENRVQAIKNKVDQPLIGDVTNPEFLKQLHVEDADHVIVCLGEDLESSILTTMHLKELGAKPVTVKAVNTLHTSILKKIGADEVIFPEKDMAQVTANRLLNPNVSEVINLSDDYSIHQVAVPTQLAGKTLRELNLTGKFRVSVLYMKQEKTGKIYNPSADSPLAPDDTMFISGEKKDLDLFYKEMKAE